MTLEEYDAWSAANERVEATHKAADECGGPALSLVPIVEQQESWPTDLLPPEKTTDDAPLPAPMPFDGVPLDDSYRRQAGWSAVRQRLFLSVLAETGSVHLAASAARLSARSAYQLRTRSPAFAQAWNAAQQLAVGRLSAIAFDRALNGRVEQVYREGELIGERRVPSDRLLTGCSRASIRSASPCRGNSAVMPTRRPKPLLPSRRCSTQSVTQSRSHRAEASSCKAMRASVEELARAGRPARSDRIDVTRFTRVTARLSRNGRRQWEDR